MTWDDYFMNIAMVTAMRSKDPNYKIGCVLVTDDNKIVGTGYNGMPRHPSKDNDKLIDWTARPKLMIIHAEMNAILNMTITSNGPLRAYVTDESCVDCIKHMIQAGVRKVYYLNPVPENYDNEQRKLLIKNYADVIQFIHYSPKEVVVRR